MLQTVFETLYFLVKIPYVCLIFSYKTGQALVSALTVSLQTIVHFSKSLHGFIKILFEDFRLFWCDIEHILISSILIVTTIIQTFINVLLTIVNTIKTGILFLFNGVVGVYNCILNFISYSFVLCSSIIVSIKHWLALLGSSIWFAITLLPVFIVYISTLSTYYIGLVLHEGLSLLSHIIQQLKTIIINAYDFIFDFPIEALMGLIVGGSVIFAIFKMQVIIYQQVLLCYQFIRSISGKIRLLLSKPIRHMQENTDSNDSDESDESFGKNNLCIICQDHDKCILMLPCRHLCVCNTCNIRLQQYDRTCPICRTVIQRTMKVFT
ncbi:hypothetical protein RN001_010270 [Aquatica leii]|uniref:RING-type domain-containing protein n=1 Tax=Aquatica leii TaxID=1421715 RepID=A0AAN7P680_9COLE|nr:hypothetical protein RN001_010270 [Aquatica leii]